MDSSLDTPTPAFDDTEDPATVSTVPPPPLPEENGFAKTDAVCQLILKKYAPPEWATLFEVANATGSAARRYADVVAMNLWPSRGLEVLGFEVKVSRQDWKRELADPSKSSAIQKYCDYWWVVAGHKTVVQPQELPANWGLLVAAGGKLLCVKEAPKLTAAPLDRGFVAAVLRRSFEKLKDCSQNPEAFQKGLEAGRTSTEYLVKQLEAKLAKLSEEHLGLLTQLGAESTSRYEQGEIPAAIQLLHKLKSTDAEHFSRAVDFAKVPLKAALDTLDTLKVVSKLANGSLLDGARQLLEEANGGCK